MKTKHVIMLLAIVVTTVTSIGIVKAVQNAVRATDDNQTFGAFAYIETTNPSLNGIVNGASYHRIAIIDDLPNVSPDTVCNVLPNDPRYIEYGWVKWAKGTPQVVTFDALLIYGIVGDPLCKNEVWTSLPNSNTHTYTITWSNCIYYDSLGNCVAGHNVYLDNVRNHAIPRRNSGVNKANHIFAGGEVASNGPAFGESMGETLVSGVLKFVQDPPNSGTHVWKAWPNNYDWRSDNSYYNQIFSPTSWDSRP